MFPHVADFAKADTILTALTRDRVSLALHHYRGGRRRRFPVLCCHGLASNRLAFDVDVEASLARHLAARGYDVYLLELRGHGASQRPPRWGWDFDHYIERDVPAAIAAILRHAGAERVHWIGHSMGGLLAYAHLARGGSRDFQSAITVGSSLNYSEGGSGFGRLMPFRRLINILPRIPVRTVARASGRFVGRVTTPYERFNVWPSNTDPRLWKRICDHGFHPVSTPVMGQLASALEPGGLRPRSGGVPYLQTLNQATAPVLALGGDRDAQCPPVAVRSTAARASATVRLFGPEHGHADHYGHFDLLMGTRARTEVFPHIDDWLDRHEEAPLDRAPPTR